MEAGKAISRHQVNKRKGHGRDLQFGGRPEDDFRSAKELFNQATGYVKEPFGRVSKLSGLFEAGFEGSMSSIKPKGPLVRMQLIALFESNLLHSFA